jgi:glycosyltransferase involved in cell wall biosynthesis
MRINNSMVSIIVPTHKGRDLTDLIESVNKSSYKNYELVIVDEGLERSMQRNIGIIRSKGEYLLFLDSDMAISCTLLEECVELIKHCNGIYLPEIVMTEGWFGKLRAFEREFYTGTKVDCVRFVRSYRCPKFNLTLSGPEDSDWDRRILGKRDTCKAPVYHFDGIGLKEYIAKKKYYTKSMRRFEECNPNDNVLDPIYRCWTVFVEKGKWTKLLRHPILTLELIGLIIIRAYIYLRYK